MVSESFFMSPTLLSSLVNKKKGFQPSINLLVSRIAFGKLKKKNRCSETIECLWCVSSAIY